MSSFKNKIRSGNTKRGLRRSSYFPKLSIHSYFFLAFHGRACFSSSNTFSSRDQDQTCQSPGQKLAHSWWQAAISVLPPRRPAGGLQATPPPPFSHKSGNSEWSELPSEQMLMSPASTPGTWLARWCWMLYPWPKTSLLFILFSFAVIWEREAYTVLVDFASSWCSS